PNNAILTLVGDLDPTEALEQIKKYFGNIPSQPAPPKVDLTEPEHYGQRRETIQDPLARLPMLLIAYHIPAGNTADNYALQVLANILSRGESSRLYQHLVKDQQLATSIQVQADTRIGPSLFYVVAMPRPGVKPEDLEKAIEAEIAAVKKDGVTEAEMNKARAQFRRRQIQSRQSDLYTAIRIGEYAAKFNDPNLINTIFDKFNAVTAQQVKEVANKYLIPSQQSVVIDLPASQKTVAANR
ncbi:MAG: pitrilysin family protein, partial [Acidobacteriota bacterium]